MTTATRTHLFDRRTFAAFAQTLNEPQWLAEKRQAAWNIFEETPMPSTSDEAWRRTSLKKVKWERFSPDVPPSVPPARTLNDLPDTLRRLLDADRPAAGRLLLVNGRVRYHEVDESVAGQGVLFTDLQTAVARHPEQVQPHLMGRCVPPSDGKFAALNAALWRNGVFLYVPAGVAVEHPFEVAILVDGEGVASIHRTLIVAEEGAQVDYIEETASTDEAHTALNVGVTEIIARPESRVRYVDLQQLGHKVYNFNTKRALAEADSNVLWDLGETGSALTKTFLDTRLIGDGSNTECNGIYFLDGKQHVDLDTLMQHTGYATSGDLLLHGALRDRARAVFIGMIKIDPSGQLTNSYLKNQNLLLSDTARADSIPALEIDANDVRASHAATISQVEEEYVFYLQSRGIPREKAVHMIVEGFFETVFNRMGNERVRQRLTEAVARKMVGLS